MVHHLQREEDPLSGRKCRFRHQSGYCNEHLAETFLARLSGASRRRGLELYLRNVSITR